jgi:lambda family phage tail tape measure protein
MPTIAELQINLDSRPIDQGTMSLNNFTEASSKVTKALKEQKAAQDAVNQGGGPSGSGNGGLGGNPAAINDISSAIDNQVKKLKTLEVQRKALNASDLKTTNPDEYNRLNQVIDTNIALVNRQGNALDRLAAQAERERKVKEASEAAEKRRLENQQNAINSSEALAAKASARQSRDLETTLSGLSAQIRAQQEYNRTVEQLNKSRATGGMNGGNGGISAAEYDTYIKLAAAKRDSALATKDESAELDRVSSKIESITATLGRAERAEVQYTRALRTLNEGLSLGVLSADQYSTKLGQIVAKREASINAANSNAAAEERFTRQLQSVVTAYDPVLTAQTRYNDSVRILSNGLQSGKLTVDQFNKALGDQRVALDNVKNAQSGSEKSINDRYQSALDKLLPYNAQLRNLAEAERALQQQQQRGKVVTDQQVADHQRATQAIADERKEIERRQAASTKNTNSAKQDAAALRGLPAQFTDIVVSLQGGQAPLTVLLQQGGQIKDMFGGIIPAIKATSTAIMGLITPLSIVGAAVAGLAIGWNAGKNEAIEFNKAIVTSGNFAGTSASQLALYRDNLDEVVGTSGKAAEALTAIASSGKIVDSLFSSVAEAAVKMERATGVSIQSVVDDFASLGKDPVNAAVTLDEKYKFLTGSVLAQANALIQMGQQQEAVNLLQTQMATAASETADKVIDRAGAMEHAWRGFKDTVLEAWDAVKGIGRDDTTTDRIRNLVKEQQTIELSARGYKNIETSASKQLLDNDKRYQQNKAELQQLQDRLESEKQSAKAAAEREQARQRGVAIDRQNIASYEANVGTVDRVKGAEEALNKVRRQGLQLAASAKAEGRELSADELKYQDAALKAAEKRVDDAKKKEEKTPIKPIDNTNVQEVKSDLTLITAEYEGYYKKITSIGDAGLVSQEATFASQKAILTAQAAAVSDSYDKQIAAINALRDNKKNSAGQNISLDNQLTKAEAAKLKAMEDISTRQEVLDNKEKGRLEERTRNISAYKEALDAQVQSARDAGARALDSVGQGDRQGGLNASLAENDRNFNKEQLKLSKEIGKDTDAYNQKLADLKDTHNALRDQIIANDKDMQEANRDWTNGFNKSVQNAQDVGMNFASSVGSALTGAFDSAGSALATFVTTGKLSFSDFARSIIADMAAIAAKQAASGALGSILSIAGTAAKAYFGTTSAGSTQAGYTGSDYSNWVKTQADGGGWSGGTQFFANGGAFTNSVVSKPTAFGMSGGQTGVMGEAGPEAIMPLTRTRDGSLGVRALSGGDSTSSGGGNTIINVNVQVAEGGSSSQSSDKNYDNFGQKLGTFVRQEVYSVLNIESRPGGSLDKGSGSR